MSAETNTIISSDLAKVREIDFVTQFGESVKKLQEMLGVTRKIKKEAGSVLKVLKVTGSLDNTTPVGEGEDIPLSHYATTWTAVGEMALKKWAKQTTIEAIMEKGFDQAVTATSEKMLKDAQSFVRGEFIKTLATGQGTSTGVGLQATIANTWAKLQNKFEDDAVASIYFVNPLDIADYLGKAQITTQTAFGFTYLKDFLGMGTVILAKDVPQGKIYATVAENLIQYYIDASTSDIAKAFSFTTDETGLIGIHESSNYDNLTNKDTVICGVKFMPEVIDGVFVGTITQPEA